MKLTTTELWFGPKQKQLVALYLLLLGILITLLVLGRRVTFRGQAEPTETPKDIYIADLARDSLKIAYRTGKPVETLVRYGKSGSESKVAIDVSSTGILTTHLVYIAGLAPGEKHDFQIGTETISQTMPPLGLYTPGQAKVITGTLVGTKEEFADTAVVLETNDRYFATRPDEEGNWLISWVNYFQPDGSLEMPNPITPSNVIVIPRGRESYKFAIRWSDVRTISAGTPPVKVKTEPKEPETLWERIKRILSIYLPQF